jgi:hypothetical protein
MKLFAFLATMILVAPTAYALDERPDVLADDSTAIRIATTFDWIWSLFRRY